MEQDILERKDSHDLIASDRVDGTAVYDRNGERLGKISHLMIGKRDGRVSYAVLSFGGLLGLGADEHPLPWETLEYDTDKGGYVVDVTKDQLESAPPYSRDNRENYDRGYYEGISGHYGYPAPAW
jgi:hypothetical protein